MLCLLAASCGRVGFAPPGHVERDGSVDIDAAPSDAALSAIAQQAYLKASNTDSNDGFGYSVALSADGSTLAIGAPGEASAATGVGGNDQRRGLRLSIGRR
jgi:hypothetical protein